MAYEEKYNATIPSTDGVTYEVEIHERDASPGVTALDADSPRRRLHGTPLRIIKTPLFDPEERLWGLFSVHCELRTLEQDTLIQAIRDADVEKYRLIVKSGSTPIHTLRVAPGKTRREIMSDPGAEQVIHAECGILSLKKREWTSDSTTRVSVLSVIGGALNTISLQLDLKVSQNWYSKDASHAATIDHLQKVRITSRALRNQIIKHLKGGDRDAFISWFEVLEYLANAYQLRIYQGSTSAWYIEQRPEKGDSQYYWNYLWNGLSSPDSQGAEDTAKTYSESAGDFFQTDVAIETGVSPLNKARLIYKHGSLTDQLFDSENFTYWDTSGDPDLPRGWVEVGSITTERALLQDGRQACHIFETVAAGNSEASAIAAVTNGMRYTVSEFGAEAGDKLRIEIPAVTFLKSGETVNATQRWYWAAVCEVTILTDAGTRYLRFDGAWDSQPAKLAFQIEFTRLLELPGQPVQFRQSNFSIETQAVPTDTRNLQFTYYEAVDGYNTPVKLDGIWWGEPVVRIQNAANRASDQRTGEITVTGDVEAGLLEFVALLGDGPLTGASPTRYTILPGALELDTGNWQLNAGTGSSGLKYENFWLVEAVAQRRIALLGYKRTISAEVDGDIPLVHEIIVAGSNRFDSMYYDWDVRNALVDAEWWEIRHDSLTTDYDEIDRDWTGLERPPVKRFRDGVPYVDPFEGGDCLMKAPLYALFPMIQSALDIAQLLNDNQALSEAPNGTLEGSAANWTWDVNTGLSKTATGTTEYVSLPLDILGPTTPSRLTVFNQLRRDTTSEIGVWKITAGTQTVIECKILTTGVVRLAVTDETGATTNVDSTVTIGSDEWAGVSHSIVPSTYYTSFYTYVLNKDDADPIQKLAVISENVSLDFTDVRLFVNNQLTIRLSHWLAQAWSKSMFLAEAICAREFTVDEGVDPGEVTNPQPAMVFRTDAGIEIYDLAGTQAYDWADATNVPGGIVCRPAWHPTHEKVFYGADEDVVSADIDGSNIAVEYSAAAGTKIRGLQYAPGNGRLYLIKSDGAGTNSFGHLSGSPGAMSYNELSTAFDAADFFANASHNVLLYEDLSDDDLYALILNTLVQLDTSTEANTAGVWYAQSEQGAYFMDTGGDVYRQFVANVPLFATTQLQVVEGSGFTSPRPNTLMIYEGEGALMFLVANDHIMVAPVALGEEFPAQLTSSDFSDIATLGDVCRGASLAQIAVSPALAAPVLVLGTETATTVPLTWGDIAGETIYVLQQSTTSAVAGFVTIEGALAAGTTSHTVTGLTAETPYWYRVRGHNAAGAGPWSNVVAATTEAVSIPAYDAVIYGRGRYIAIRDVDLVSNVNETWYDSGASNTVINGVGFFNNRVYFGTELGGVIKSMLPDKTDVQTVYTGTSTPSVYARQDLGLLLVLDEDGTGDLVIKKWNGSSFDTLINVTDNAGVFVPRSPARLNRLMISANKLVICSSTSNPDSIWYCDLDGSNPGSADLALAGPQLVRAYQSEDQSYLITYEFVTSSSFRIFRQDWGTWANRTLIFNDTTVFVTYHFSCYNPNDSNYYDFSHNSQKIAKRTVLGSPSAQSIGAGSTTGDVALIVKP